MLDKKNLSEIRRMADKAKSHEKQSRGFTEERLKESQVAARRSLDVINEATRLIKENVFKRDIVGTIARNTGGKPRTIRRYLYNHPCGYWKPKQKK